jgi:hypothetical protein
MLIVNNGLNRFKEEIDELLTQSFLNIGEYYFEVDDHDLEN